MSFRIPFTPASSLASGLHVLAALGGSPPHPFQIDTGSVGILVPRSVLGPAFQNFDPSKDITFGFISSGNHYHGQWVDVPVVIGVPEAWDGAGEFPTAVVEVFAVDQPADFSGGMLGIGFAIEKDANGGANRNPFLHLTQAGENLAPSYIIREEGIDVGLEQIAFDVFALVPLIRNAHDDDWLQPTGILGLAETFSVDLPLLMDTGIQEMLVFLPMQDRPATLASFSSLPDGVAVSVSVPVSRGGHALAYRFVTGDADEAMAPSTVQWRPNGHGINTGRNVLAGVDYLFDAAGGQVGFRTR
jgi:hypothetical protein